VRHGAQGDFGRINLGNNQDVDLEFKFIFSDTSEQACASM